MASAKKSKAVALKYNVEEDLAPIVIASGYGEVAERIIGVAEQRGIPVFRDDSGLPALYAGGGQQHPAGAVRGGGCDLLPAA